MANHPLRNLLLCLPFLLIMCFDTAAQSVGAEWGLGLGASIYQGDLSPHWLGAYNRPGPCFQLMAQKNIFSGFALRGYYAYASISDNESSYTTGIHRFRNFSFDASINELAVQLVVNPNFNNGQEETGNFHFYFFGGFGVGFTSIRRDFSKFNRSFPYWQTWVVPGLQTDSLKRLPSSIATIPVGAGLRYQIGDNLALFGEVNKRITGNEYLDGFSKSANPSKNDAFSSLVFGLNFRLSGGNGGRGSTDCPKNVY